MSDLLPQRARAFLQRPISKEAQMKQNLGALSWNLSKDDVAYLDKASQQAPVYPYWHQMGFDERNPKPTTW